MIDLVRNTQQALGEERFHLAGNSMGGFLSWNYTALYPQYVDRLILIDPPCYPQRLQPARPIPQTR